MSRRREIPISELRDGQRFTIDRVEWHLAAVNMSVMGSVACYASGRKSSNGMTYRVDVAGITVVMVEES